MQQTEDAIRWDRTRLLLQVQNLPAWEQSQTIQQCKTSISIVAHGQTGAAAPTLVQTRLQNSRSVILMMVSVSQVTLTLWERLLLALVGINDLSNVSRRRNNEAFSKVRWETNPPDPLSALRGC